MKFKNLFTFRDFQSVAFSVIVAVFTVVFSVSAATTISTNINTGGTLTVSGASTLTGAVDMASTLTVTGAFTGASSGTLTGDLFVNGADINLGTGSATSTITSAAGNLGVATTTPAQRFSVQGNGLFSGDLSVAGLTATGTVAFNGTAATTTISGGLLVDTTSLMVDYSTNRVGIATTSPGEEVGIAGDVLMSSGATTTLRMHSTLANTGSCIQLRGTNGVNFRVFASATTSSYGFLQVEAGNCQ